MRARFTGRTRARARGAARLGRRSACAASPSQDATDDDLRPSSPPSHGSDATFAAGTTIWLDQRFRDWKHRNVSVERGCPVLLIQGDADATARPRSSTRSSRAYPTRRCCSCRVRTQSASRSGDLVLTASPASSRRARRTRRTSDQLGARLYDATSAASVVRQRDVVRPRAAPVDGQRSASPTAPAPSR